MSAPEHWPRPRQIAPVKAQGDFTGDDWLICSFGNSGEDGKDWVLVTDSVRASELADCYFPSDAKHDAEFLVQLLDAYRMGRIVHRDPAVLAALPEVQALVAAAYLDARQALDCGCKPDKSDCLCAGGTVSICYRDGLPDVDALIPADHAAALAARDAKMRAEGRKEGMERAGDLCNSVANALGARPGSPMFSALIEYRAAIRAEMGGEA